MMNESETSLGPEYGEWVGLLLFRTKGMDFESYREDTVVIKADSREEAQEIAVGAGRDQNGAYINALGDPVTCEFLGIVDLNRRAFDTWSGRVLDVYSRHFEDIDSYRSFDPLAKRLLDDQPDERAEHPG